MERPILDQPIGPGLKGCDRGCKLSYRYLITLTLIPWNFISCYFLPRCMECRRGLAMRILSVCPSVRPSVRLSYAWILTKR